MQTKNVLLRSLTFIMGLFIMAFGVALSVEANLGVSPISCIPYVYSVKFPLTMGTTTVVFNVLLILLQMVVLRKKYQFFQLIQFPVVFLFGVFTDLTLYLASGLEVTTYTGQLGLCLLSFVVLAFGVFLEVKARITYLPGEGLALAIADTFHQEFGKCKIGVDCSMVVLGTLSSSLLLDQIQGVREGTIAAALAVGFLARLYSKWLPGVDKWLAGAEPTDAVTIAADQQPQIPHMVVTISREYGSGGHAIGQRLAEKLGIAFYDKELIDLSAQQSGFTPEYIAEHEQKLSSSLLHDLYEQEYAYINEKMPPLDALFLIQSEVIRNISQKTSCVIVGRCANFILKGQTACFHVFIHADETFREQRAITQYGVDPSQAGKLLHKTNRDRANYCLHYTNRVWNDASNYDLTVNSGKVGIEQTVDLILQSLSIQA